MTLKRPTPQESHDYFKLYIGQVEGNDFVSTLTQYMDETTALLEKLTEAQWNHRYAEGKWSIREVMLHIMDTERIMAYRALRISRNDQTNLMGFEQDDYIPFCEAEQRTVASIIEEYRTLRQATIVQFKNYSDAMLDRMGVANDAALSTRALGYIITGHEIHHMRIIHERYLV